LQENKSSGIGGLFSKPLSHFLIGPGPFKRMGIQLIVLWPSGVDVVDQFLAAVPRAALQVTPTFRTPLVEVAYFTACLAN
jgi:hypothetical protein